MLGCLCKNPAALGLDGLAPGLSLAGFLGGGSRFVCTAGTTGLFFFFLIDAVTSESLITPPVSGSGSSIGTGGGSCDLGINRRVLGS